MFIRITGSRSEEEACERHHEYQLLCEREMEAKNMPNDDHDLFGITHDMRGMAKSDGLSLFHKALLPEKVILDQVPMRGKTPGKYYSTVCVRNLNTPWFDFVRQVRERCGKDPAQIGEIALRGPNISERNFVPQLCDHLAEICNVRPPNENSCGWLVSVSGSRDGRHMMHELQKIPGFFVRWADEGDGLFDDAEPALEMSPPNCAGSFEDSSSPTETDDVRSLSTPQTNNHVLSALLHPSPTHPHLRRTLIHTYRGRPLIEDNSTGETKFLDESAIFVGRLNKRMETYATLYKRFEKYGKICNMEFNPKAVPSHVNNATARIMYQGQESAARAIARENGSISFGTAIKVELRRVIHSDVHTRRVYVDLTGRIIRPPTLSNLACEPAIKRVTESQSAIEARMRQPQFSSGLNMPSAAYLPMSSQQPGFLQPDVGIGMPTATFPPRFSLSPPAFSTGHGFQHLSMLGGQGHLSPTYDHIMPIVNSFVHVGQLSNGMMTADRFLYPLSEAFQSPQSLTGKSSSMAYPPAEEVHFQPPLDEQFFAGQSHAIPATVQYPVSALDEPSSRTPGVSSHPELPTIAPIGDEGISSNMKLKPVAYKEENGTVKAIYDDNELKAYCVQNNLPYPPKPEKTIKKGSDETFTVTQDWRKSLLPVQTGGHDSSLPSPLRRGSLAFSEAQELSSLSRLRLRRSQSDYSLPTNRKPQDCCRVVDERVNVANASTTSHCKENSYCSSPRLAKPPLLNHDPMPDYRNQLIQAQANNFPDTHGNLKQPPFNLPFRQPLSPPNVQFDPENLEERMCHLDIHGQNSLSTFTSSAQAQGSQGWYSTSFDALTYQLQNQQPATKHIPPDGNSWIANESPVVQGPKCDRVRSKARGRGSRRKTFFGRFSGEQHLSKQ